MRITRLGAKAFVFYTMLISAFYAAPYLNLFFLLLAFCTVMPLMNLWWAYRNLAGVRGFVESDAPMPAGTSVAGHVRLQCARRIRYHLGVDLRIADKIHRVLPDCELHPGETQRFDLTMPSLERGLHPIAIARVTTLFPFGLLELSRRLETRGALVVYPAPADLARYRDRNNSDGQGLGGKHAEELGPAGLREFRDGDELRLVHWKASARRTELVVREFEGDASPGMEVLLDLRTSGDRLEEALSLVTALALESQTRKEVFTLHTQDHRGTYGEGHGAIEGLLTYLASAEGLPADGPPPPSVSPQVLRLPLQGRTPKGPAIQPVEASC